MTRDPTELLSSLNASVHQSFAHEAECNARNENPAGWVFVRLVDQINAFEDLSPDLCLSRRLSYSRRGLLEP